MTQTELAKKTGISKSLINKYLKSKAEAGNDNLTLLAKALDINEVWLMGYSVEKNKYHTILPTDKIVMWDNILGFRKNEEVDFKYFAMSIYDYETIIDELIKLFLKASDEIKNFAKNTDYKNIKNFLKFFSESIEFKLTSESIKADNQKMLKEYKKINVKYIKVVNDNLFYLNEIKKYKNVDEKIEEYKNRMEKALKASEFNVFKVPIDRNILMQLQEEEMLEINERNKKD